MKIYAMTIGKKTLFFTNRKKCIAFMNEKIGHEPVAACIPAMTIGEEPQWLYGAEIKAAMNGKIRMKKITFFGMTANGYCFNEYTLHEIETN